jgi:hypothetical protein
MTTRDTQSPDYFGVVATALALALLFWVMTQ